MNDRPRTWIANFFLWGVLPLGLISNIVSPIMASTLTSASSFSQWCEQRNTLGAETKATIEALLVAVGTIENGVTDCQQAETRLQSVTSFSMSALLSPPNLTTNSQSEDTSCLINHFSCLSITLPTVVDLRPVVAAMPKLRILNLSHSLIRNFTPLQNFSQLEELNLSHTGLIDLSPLTTLSTLVKLDISFNQVRDISPLAGFDRLQELNFRHNAVQNLSILATLTSLRSLGLRNNPIDPRTCPSPWGDACDPHTYLDRSQAASATSVYVPDRTIPGVAKPYCANQSQLGLNACADQWSFITEFFRVMITGDLSQQISPDLRNKLIDIDKNWSDFRRNHCEELSEPIQGGSAYPMVFNNCLAKMTNDRIADLQGWGEPEQDAARASYRLRSLIAALELPPINAQQQWEQYQTQHCQFEGLRFPDRPDQVELCRQRLLASRIRQVEEIGRVR